MAGENELLESARAAAAFVMADQVTPAETAQPGQPSADGETPTWVSNWNAVADDDQMYEMARNLVKPAAVRRAEETARRQAAQQAPQGQQAQLQQSQPDPGRVRRLRLDGLTNEEITQLENDLFQAQQDRGLLVPPTETYDEGETYEDEPQVLYNAYGVEVGRLA